MPRFMLKNETKGPELKLELVKEANKVVVRCYISDKNFNDILAFNNSGKIELFKLSKDFIEDSGIQTEIDSKYEYILVVKEF